MSGDHGSTKTHGDAVLPPLVALVYAALATPPVTRKLVKTRPRFPKATAEVEAVYEARDALGAWEGPEEAKQVTGGRDAYLWFRSSR